MFAIPIRQDSGSFQQNIVMDRVSYKIHIYYNTRDEAWYISIATQEDVDILSGVKIVLGYPLINRFGIDEAPQGVLIAIDTSNSGAEKITRDNFGTDIQLIYITVDDIATI